MGKAKRRVVRILAAAALVAAGVLARAAASADLTRWQLLFEGRSYAIQSVDDMEFRHRLCKIRAVQK